MELRSPSRASFPRPLIQCRFARPQNPIFTVPQEFTHRPIPSDVSNTPRFLRKLLAFSCQLPLSGYDVEMQSRGSYPSNYSPGLHGEMATWPRVVRLSARMATSSHHRTENARRRICGTAIFGVIPIHGTGPEPLGLFLGAGPSGLFRWHALAIWFCPFCCNPTLSLGQQRRSSPVSAGVPTAWMLTVTVAGPSEWKFRGVVY